MEYGSNLESPKRLVGLTCCFTAICCLVVTGCCLGSERATLFLPLGIFLFSAILTIFLTGLICCLSDPLLATFGSFCGISPFSTISVLSRPVS